MLILSEMRVSNDPEPTFEVRDYHSGTQEPYTAVKVHPWHRRKGQAHESYQVFVSVGNYLPDGTEERINDEEPVWNIIVDRNEFVAGLLHAFPELRMREAGE